MPFHHNTRSIENSALAFQTKNAWKFPGGLSDLGENIGECPAQRAKERKKEKKTNIARVAPTFTFISWNYIKRHIVYIYIYIFIFA